MLQILFKVWVLTWVKYQVLWVNLETTFKEKTQFYQQSKKYKVKYKRNANPIYYNCSHFTTPTVHSFAQGDTKQLTFRSEKEFFV